MKRRFLKTLAVSTVLCGVLAFPSYAENATVSGSGVNMRSGPGTTYRILDCLSKGAVVDVLSDAVGGWCSVEYYGKTGYISTDYLSFSGSASIVFSPQADIATDIFSFSEPAPAPVPTAVPSPSLSAPAATGQVIIIGSDTVSDPLPSAIPSPLPTSVPTAMPTAVPSPFSTDDPAPGKDEIPAAVDLSMTNPADLPGTAGYITGSRVRFRSAPSLDSSILCEFYYGNPVTIIGTTGEWSAVSANGKTGYVYSVYVREGIYSAETGTQHDTVPEIPSLVGKDENISEPEASQTAPPAATASGSLIAAYAVRFLGTKYCWGGADPSTGFDCSGFVTYVYSQFGISLNRVAQDQAKDGTHVDSSALKPGDVLCFYSGNGYIGHSGIYLGNGKFIHSANSASGVIISDLAGNYSSCGFEARRIV